MADLIIRRRVWRRVVRSSLEKVPVGGSGGSYGGGGVAYCRARTVRYESSEFSLRLPNSSLDELDSASIDRVVREIERKTDRVSLAGSKGRSLLPYSGDGYYSRY